jgi:hypothetical protein
MSPRAPDTLSRWGGSTAYAWSGAGMMESVGRARARDMVSAPHDRNCHRRSRARALAVRSSEAVRRNARAQGDFRLIGSALDAMDFVAFGKQQADHRCAATVSAFRREEDQSLAGGGEPEKGRWHRLALFGFAECLAAGLNVPHGRCAHHPGLRFRYSASTPGARRHVDVEYYPCAIDAAVANAPAPAARDS